MSVRLSVDLEQSLAELVGGRLRPREDIREAHWRFWERRTLNLHRVVAHWTYGATTPERMGAETRDAIARHFRCAWWRGLGFGAVVEVRETASFPDDYARLVDGRANSRGTWQWLVLVSRASGRAWGLHTWIEGYLSPVYRGLLLRLEEQGCAVESVRKEKDGLMRLLTATRPGRFPEFENDLGDSGRPLTRH